MADASAMEVATEATTEEPAAKRARTSVGGEDLELSHRVVPAMLAKLKDEDVLWEDALWVVVHKRPPCGVVGHLQLIAKRHFQGPSKMLDEEAVAVGVALRQCEAALEKVTGCDRVYTAALGSLKSGGHFHAHMLPVFDAKPPPHVTGTPWDIFLQEKLAADGAEGAAADPEECLKVAAAFKEQMRATAENLSSQKLSGQTDAEVVMLAQEIKSHVTPALKEQIQEIVVRKDLEETDKMEQIRKIVRDAHNAAVVAAEQAAEGEGQAEA